MYGEKLRELRKIEGWTQEEVAKKLNISKQTYSHYENENRRPGLDMVRELANVYQVDIDTIFAKDSSAPDTQGAKADDAVLLDGIKKIIEKHDMDLSDPRTLEYLDSALDLIKRMRDE